MLTAPLAGQKGRPSVGSPVFVTSQGLYYDTTEFGPGDPGYLGGRWWEDTIGNGIQDDGDRFFHWPLSPPGRPTP